MIIVVLVLGWAVIEAAMAIAGAAHPGTKRYRLFLRRMDWQN
jgi:hypothetical protein